MHKTITSLIALALVIGLLGAPADAQTVRQPPMPPESFLFDTADAEAMPIVPGEGWHALPMGGDVWANGRLVGAVDFVLFWEAADQPRAQLWALWQGAPTPVCHGVIFETPQGEPIFFGSTFVEHPAATCHMARTPDFDEISLLVATEDGQWATAILGNPMWRGADAALALG